MKPSPKFRPFIVELIIKVRIIKNVPQLKSIIALSWVKMIPAS